jgi:cytochrome c biogenesis protein CcmG/thiol:disulfide interchange protein DsbE
VFWRSAIVVIVSREQRDAMQVQSRARRRHDADCLRSLVAIVEICWRQMNRHLIPLLVFVVIVGFLWAGLSLNPREVPSPLIGKPAPEFSLPQLRNPGAVINAADLRGQVWLLNVFASWCTPCLEEHPYLVDLAKSGVVPVYGLNYKDRHEAALRWLNKHGDPYVGIVVDAEGRTGIDYGVYGVPETFVIDKLGVIRFKHIGPLTPEVLDEDIVPLVKRLRA